MRVDQPGRLEPVGPHRGELGHVVHGVAVLHLDDERRGVADDLVESRLLAAFVDPGQVLLEELGVLLVTHRGVGVEVDHDVVLSLTGTVFCSSAQRPGCVPRDACAAAAAITDPSVRPSSGPALHPRGMRFSGTRTGCRTSRTFVLEQPSSGPVEEPRTVVWRCRRVSRNTWRSTAWRRTPSTPSSRVPTAPSGLEIHARGLAVLDDPQLNRGTAFTMEERDELGLHGLLPAGTGDDRPAGRSLLRAVQGQVVRRREVGVPDPAARQQRGAVLPAGR